MTRQQIVLRAPPSIYDRRQPLLNATSSDHPSLHRRKRRVAEVAGGTAAECAAVWCCCPCGLVDLLVLAVYKVPAGLCRKALRRKRRLRLVKMGLMPATSSGTASSGEINSNKCCGGGDDEEMFQACCSVTGPDHSTSQMMIELEKEMFDNFYSGGFWRSMSQRSGTHE